MTPELRHALDNAYDVFACYNAPRDFIYAHGVPHWPRNLSVNDWCQLSYDNDLEVRLLEADVLRHFLPRWLELMRDDATDTNFKFWWDEWRLEGTLEYTKWLTWPAPEIVALRAVFLAWTREALAKYGGEPPLDFLIKVGEDLAPHLELWLDADLPALARWLWMVNWPDTPTAQHWATSSRLENELEAAFFADSDGPNAELYSRSIELVRSLRAL